MWAYVINAAIVGIGIFGCASTWGHTDSQDVFALRVLYESLKSPSLSGWSVAAGGDPCGDLWQGVECSGKNVIAIRLPGLGLRGSIGHSLNKFTSLLTLDLSDNHIGEMLPFELPPRILQLYLGDNVLIGSIPYSIKRLMSLTNLNLSTNFLSEEIPDVFEKLSNLHTLDLSNNNFTGELPLSFCSLSSLTTLHLQQNQLNGTLTVLQQLPLKDLNVESNHFSGALPSGLDKIPIFRDDDNPQLKNMSEKSSPSNRTRNGARLAGFILGAAASASIIAFTLSFLIHKRVCRSQFNAEVDDAASSSSQPGRFLPHGSQKDRFDDISQFSSPDRGRFLSFKAPMEKASGNIMPLKGTNLSILAAEYTLAELVAGTLNFNKDNLIGEGLLGTVYKGMFSNGKVVAIKKLESSSLAVRSSNEILAILSNISRFRHSNVVELIGYCFECNQCYLVYNYFTKGPLHEMLHSRDDNKKCLSWNVRMKIALGAARALEYLHEVCVPSTVHRNFKSANILLDEELNPHLSDSGLAAFVAFAAERQISTQMLGSFGYSAPEYALSGIYTIKSDVYSFGVVMLELLTGKEPLDSSKPRSLDQSLVKWAVPQLHDIDALSKIVDPSLNGMYPAKALSQFAEIVSQCIEIDPQARPSMSEVVQSLVTIMHRIGTSKRTISREIGLQRSMDQSSSYEKSFECDLENLHVV